MNISEQNPQPGRAATLPHPCPQQTGNDPARGPVGGTAGTANAQNLSVIPGATLVYRFVPHANAANYTLAGWEDRGPAPGHHGHWSRVMIWRGKGYPAEPPSAREPRKGAA